MKIKIKIKRHFQLLEVLIAMTLVSLCLLPLLSPHIYMYQEQKQLVREMGVDHLARLVFADILEKLFKNEISWEDIRSKRELTLDDSDFSRIQASAPQGYQGSYFFKELIHKSSSDGSKTHYQVEVVIKFHPKQASKLSGEDLEYRYVVFIQHLQKHKDGTSNKPMA